MNKKNIKVLLDEGFSIKTIRSLSENQRNILAKKILNEAQTSIVKQTTYPKAEVDKMKKEGGLPVNGKVVPNQDGSLTVVSGDGEMKENQDDLTALTREGLHDADDMAPDGMDDDSDNNRSMMNELSDEEIDLMLDIIKSKKSNGEKGEIEEKFQSKSQQKYFFAKCNDESLSKKERNKWCSMADEFAQHTNFKKLPEKVKEDNLKSLEESVMKIVKKHIPASITKGDLVKLVNEAPLTKPVPVKEPGVVPSRPERKTPFQPKHIPKPKAGKELPDWMSYSEIFDSEPFTKPVPVKPDVAPSKPERKTPFQPKHKPKPKADKK
jgi:hypothetical protein